MLEFELEYGKGKTDRDCMCVYLGGWSASVMCFVKI
jgi:hypothetical protein